MMVYDIRHVNEHICNIVTMSFFYQRYGMKLHLPSLFLFQRMSGHSPPLSDGAITPIISVQVTKCGCSITSELLALTSELMWLSLIFAVLATQGIRLVLVSTWSTHPTTAESGDLSSIDVCRLIQAVYRDQ